MSGGTSIHRKIAVVGFPCVGKSSITLKYVDNSFPDDYDPTIGEEHTKRVKFRDRLYSLAIIDTAGHYEHSLLPQDCVVNVHGYVIVYAIDNQKSFQTVRVIRDKILDNVAAMHIPMVLVGNKEDLQYNSREVPREEGEKLAKEWGAAFIETSAKEKEVGVIFDKMLYEIEVSQGNIPRDKNGQNKCVVQ